MLIEWSKLIELIMLNKWSKLIIRIHYLNWRCFHTKYTVFKIAVHSWLLPLCVFCFCRYEIYPFTLLMASYISATSVFRSSSPIYPSSAATPRWSIDSKSEPRATLKNWIFSWKCYLPYPSAILADTDGMLHYNWDFKWNCSYLGKALAILWIFFLNATAFWYTTRSSSISSIVYWLRSIHLPSFTK